MGKINFRYATKTDVPLILQFIRDLAKYEKMENEVVATEEILTEWIFDNKKAEVIFALDGEKEVGFALFFHNFSTFLGRAGLYLEDLYVKPEYRRHGFGRAILRKLAQITRDQGFERLEWCCLNWNESSIAFYLSIGATPMSEWTTYRLTGDALTRVIKS